MLYDVEPVLWHRGIPYDQAKQLMGLLTHVTRRVDWILMSADREDLTDEQRKPRDELLQVR
jgi:hypothetical protein